ncbi:hypothetical protein CTEN210_03592 [Chaetoceros tenuissimus]|uniref:RING-type domain-containing protein n=1 Tax=Chaetoceros tenuissimus TaxID=426638 RepID=A0AAD3H1H7_9STRA|nr:hypothetical protein CTEN210_03592 [Chaetoceros tenuissimus]
MNTSDRKSETCTSESRCAESSSPEARKLEKKPDHDLVSGSSRFAKRSRDQAGDCTSTSTRSKKSKARESFKQKGDEQSIVIPEKDKAIVTEKEEVINNKKKRSASDDIDDTHCPICLEKLNDPHIVPECCHRFCKGCIEEALEYRRECPICRGRVTSRRALRRDEVFGKLVHLLDVEKAKVNANIAATLQILNVDEHSNDAVATDDHQTKFREKKEAINISSIDSTPGAQNEKKKSRSSGKKGPSKKKTIGSPIFIQKTYHMIDSCDPTIASWSDSGDTFVVKDVETFAKNIIPQCFKHNNFTSFVRQLNFYGFRKIKYEPNKISKGEEGPESKYWRFRHDFFLRGRPDLLCIIKKTIQSHGAAQDVVNALKNEVAYLKSQLAAMKGKMEKDLQTQLQQNSHRIQHLENLQKQLHEKNQRIYYLQTLLQEKNQIHLENIAAIVKDLQSQLQQKNDRINELEEILQEVTKKLDGVKLQEVSTVKYLQKQLHEKNQRIYYLQTLLQEKNQIHLENIAAIVKDLQSQLQQKNDRIKELEEILQEVTKKLDGVETKLQQNNDRIQHLESRGKADKEKLQCLSQERKHLEAQLEEEKTRSDAFEKVARTLSYKHEIESMAAAVKDMQSQFQQKNERIQFLESNAVKDLQSRFQERDDRIKYLESKQKADEENLRKKNDKIKTLEVLVGTLSHDDKLQKIASKFQQKNERIKFLESVKEKDEEKLRQMTAVVSSLKKKLEEGK